MIDASTEIVIDSEDIEVVIDKNVSLIDNNIDVKTLEPEYEIAINRKEYTIVGDELYIPKRYEDAPQWLRDIIDNVTDVALSAKINDINNLTQSLNNLIDELEVAKNTYTMSVISSNDINERINAAIETLNSSIMESDATIVRLITTRATPEQAQAISIDAIRTSLNDTISGNSLGSIIGRINATTTTGDFTNAQSIDVLKSTIEGNADSTASAINTINTFAGLDSTGAYTYTGLTGYLVDPNTGMIGGGQSELQNTITTTGDNVEAKFEYGSNIKIGGKYHNAGFGLKTTMTGGDGTIADPYNSEFWINAEKFKFTNNSVSGQATPFSIDATGLQPKITFNGIVNFSNIANTNGTGSNLLYNSAPKIGSETKGWYVWSNSGMTVNLSAGWAEWKPTGGASVAANIGGNPAIGSVYDVGQSSRFPVIAGSRYEASAYVSAHRSNSHIYLVFYDTAGTQVGDASGNVINYAGSSALVNWGRSSVFATAPGNAATATLIIRSVVIGSYPYCFVTNAFAGAAEINQTTPSVWSEGTSAGATYTSELSNDAGFTTLSAVNSNIYTNNDVFAQRLGYLSYADMVSKATAGQTIINGGYLRGELIEANSITAGQINAYAITGKHISGGTINGTDINGVRITGAIIKASFIDYTSNLALSNWQHFTQANVPPDYAANFAHNNDGSLLVDSVGYVRLPAQSGFKTTGTIKTLGGDFSGINVVYNETYNETFNIYPWNYYTINTLNRAIYPDVNTNYLSGEFKIVTECAIHSFSKGWDGSHNYYDFYIDFLGDTIQGHAYINTNSSGTNSWRTWYVNGSGVGTAYSKTVKGITYTLSSEFYNVIFNPGAGHMYLGEAGWEWVSDETISGVGWMFTMTADFTGNKTITAYNFNDLMKLTRSEGLLYSSPDSGKTIPTCVFKHTLKYPVLNVQ